jgi:hypothetical protein
MKKPVASPWHSKINKPISAGNVQLIGTQKLENIFIGGLLENWL